MYIRNQRLALSGATEPATGLVVTVGAMLALFVAGVVFLEHSDRKRRKGR